MKPHRILALSAVLVLAWLSYWVMLSQTPSNPRPALLPVAKVFYWLPNLVATRALTVQQFIDTRGAILLAWPCFVSICGVAIMLRKRRVTAP